MNRIITGLLNDFCIAQKIDEKLDESVTFEYFSAHLIISSLSENTSTTQHTVVGGNSQPSVDAIGIIINGNLIEKEDEIEALISINNYLDVDFIFMQAKTSENFEATVLADLGEFADSFIEEEKCATDTQPVALIRSIKNRIYKDSKYFKNRNPNIHIYYVTTGIKPISDLNFQRKEQKIIRDFKGHANSDFCQINLIGAREIQELKRQLENSIAREIQFSRKVAMPQTPGIDEAYLGVVTARTFISLLEGQAGNMLSSIFYDNVRDWQGSNTVNSGMTTTLKDSDSKTRFVFMNNGITVIAKKIRSTGEKIHLEDYQIVNGCQTSNVLWNNRSELDDTVLIPLKIVATTNEKVVLDIIKATNSQTTVTASQLLAATDFQKQLEQHLQVQSNLPLYYERRSKQFTNTTIDRARILTPISLMKAYASIILEAPHQTTRDFQSIIERAGTSIFGAKHKLELYYMSALAQYWIDQFLRKGLIDRNLTVARFQILLAFKIMNQPGEMPAVDSNKAKRWANDLTKSLKDQDAAFASFTDSVTLVAELLTSKKNKRDAARSSSFTDEVKVSAKALRVATIPA